MYYINLISNLFVFYCYNEYKRIQRVITNLRQIKFSRNQSNNDRYAIEVHYRLVRHQLQKHMIYRIANDSQDMGRTDVHTRRTKHIKYMLGNHTLCELHSVSLTSSWTHDDTWRPPVLQINVLQHYEIRTFPFSHVMMWIIYLILLWLRKYRNSVLFSNCHSM